MDVAGVGCHRVESKEGEIDIIQIPAVPLSNVIPLKFLNRSSIVTSSLNKTALILIMKKTTPSSIMHKSIEATHRVCQV